MTKKEFEERIESYEKQIELYESQSNCLKNEIKKLKAELSKAVEDEIPEFPEFNSEDIIWYKDDGFKVVHYMTNESLKRRDYNNFHTEEYVKEYTEKSREIAMLLHCKWYIDRNYVSDWSDGDEVKYCVTYNHNEKSYIPDYFYETEYSTPYFSTKRAAQKAADWMNKHYKRNKES